MILSKLIMKWCLMNMGLIVLTLVTFNNVLVVITIFSVGLFILTITIIVLMSRLFYYIKKKEVGINRREV